MENESHSQHRPAYAAVNLLTIAVFAAAIIFNVFATGALPSNIFENTTAEVSKYYTTDITPAGWTFIIWSVIYVWQGLWLLYGLTLVCRSTSYGYLYINPGHQPELVYVVFIFNLLCNIAWLFMWDRFWPQYALIFLPLTAITLFICMAISTVKLYNVSPVLLRENARKEVWFTRIFTHNGLAVYAAWVSIASLINLDVVLIQFTSLTVQTSGTICLAVIFLQVVTWFYLDNFVWDRFLRYIITPYAVFIVALVGIVMKNWDPDSSNSVLTACLLVVSCVALLAKIVIMIWKHNKRPLFGDIGTSFYTQQVSYGTLAQDKDYSESLH